MDRLHLTFILKDRHVRRLGDFIFFFFLRLQGNYSKINLKVLTLFSETETRFQMDFTNLIFLMTNHSCESMLRIEGL